MFDIVEYIQNFLNSDREHIKSYEWHCVYKDMSVHVNGDFPHKLIESRRPQEDQERHKFRQENYEPITKGIMREAINSLFRIFNECNYDLKLSPELTVLINTPYYGGMKFMNWVQTQLMYQMILDPNSLVVVLPSGPGLYDPTIAVIPKTVIVPSCQIKDKNDHIVTFLSDEHSVVESNGKPSYSGKVYYILTELNVYRLEQYGKVTDDTYVITLEYPHNIGQIPAVTLGGEWNQHKGIYESFFSAFLPFANEAIRQYSDWQGTMIVSAYPHRIIKYVECTYRDCDSGYLCGDKNRICPSCSGTGKAPSSSPYGVWIVEQGNEAVGDKVDTTPPISFVSPDVGIIDYAQKAWMELLKRAKETLHLDMIEAAQSGAAKAIDREREYALILKISNNVYGNIIYKLLLFFEYYINTRNPKKPQVVQPREFSLKTESDLVNDIMLLKQSGAPINLINEVTRELLKRRYSGNEDLYLTHLLLMEYDVLYMYSPQEKLDMLAAGVITKDIYTISLYSKSALDLFLRTNKDRVELIPANFEYIKRELSKSIPAISTNVTPGIDPNLPAPLNSASGLINPEDYDLDSTY